jgi:hypothetical protein
MEISYNEHKFFENFLYMIFYKPELNVAQMFNSSW